MSGFFVWVEISHFKIGFFLLNLVGLLKFDLISHESCFLSGLLVDLSCVFSVFFF